MILAVDIGNSKIAFGIFQHDALISQRRIPSSPARSVADYWKELEQCCSDSKVSPRQIEGVVIASVVPALQDRFIAMITEHLNIDPLIVSAKINLGITLHYDDPGKLGADRICNVVAAYSVYGGPAIVVSLGTATTFDVISHKGDFLGGVIAPGIMTAGTNLHLLTAQLANVDVEFPKHIIRQDTISSIQAGISFGGIDATDGIVRRITSELGANTIVIGTGGLIEIIAPHTRIFNHIEPSLVLQGAYLIYRRVQNNR